MYKLGVVSDSHKNRSQLLRAAERLKDCDELIHLGDCANDVSVISERLQKRVYAVCGNCDFQSIAPAEMTLQIAGKKLLCCHGHRFLVKQSLTALSLRAREAGADIVLYGHTHLPDVDFDGGRMFANPGALTDGRLMILEFRENGVCPIMIDLNTDF